MAQQNELAPNTTAYHQERLAYLPDDLLPATLAGPILEQARETSVLLSLGRRVPVSYAGTTFPITTRRPAVGQVGVGTANSEREGHLKPLSGVAWSSKSFAPIKLATIVTASEEMARENPLGLFSQLRGEMADAMGRAMDLAVVHGRRADTGAPLLGIDPTNVLANVTDEVAVPTDENVYDSLIAAYDIVVNNQHDFSAWGFDPRIKGRLLQDGVARDTAGNIVSPGEVNLRASQGSVLGFPAVYTRAIGGDFDAATLTDLRGVGGDYSQLMWGLADEIRFKVTDTASLTDGSLTVGLWQTNQVAVMIECTFGWVLGDPAAFVKITDEGFTPTS